MRGLSATHVATVAKALRASGAVDQVRCESCGGMVAVAGWSRHRRNSCRTDQPMPTPEDCRAASSAATMRAIAQAPKATARQRAIAARFVELYDAFRDAQGLPPAEALKLAADETRPYAESLAALSSLEA